MNISFTMARANERMNEWGTAKKNHIYLMLELLEIRFFSPLFPMCELFPSFLSLQSKSPLRIEKKIFSRSILSTIEWKYVATISLFSLSRLVCLEHTYMNGSFGVMGLRVSFGDKISCELWEMRFGRRRCFI